MSFTSLIHKTWRENHLFAVLLELTYRCNLDCFFCYNDLGLKGTLLSRSQYFDLFVQLREMQVLNLTFSGGEPLAHPHFLELGRRARELGFLVRIKSNGHALSGALARRIRNEVDPFMVEVSLHGATASTHDRQTRVPGSFQRLLANLREMRELGFRVKLNSALTAWNEAELDATLALAARLGLPIQIDPEVSPRDDGDETPLRIRPSRQAVKRLLQQQRREASLVQLEGQQAGLTVSRQGDAELPPAESGKHCGAGSATLTIDPYGNVFPCVQWRQPLGNLHRESVSEIWSAARLEAIREKALEVGRMVAGHGEAGQHMGFCPGLAHSLSGDPLELYPGAERKMQFHRELSP